MYTLWEALHDNSIHVASDGSHKPDTYFGAGAAVMTCDQTDNNKFTSIAAGSKCCAVESMTSLTPEQSGLISALLILHIISLRSGSPFVPSIVHIWIDSAELLARVKTTENDDIRLESYGVQDYGDMQLLRNLQLILPHHLKIKYHKIKSHQDQRSSSLSFEVSLNVKADELANYMNFHMHGPICSYQSTPHDGMILRNHQGVMITNTNQFIRCQVKGDKIRTYLRDKHNWTDATFALIDWNSLEMYLRSLPLT